ncbi:glycosyltransferase family 39 protein [Candidatus Pandoraea novymonadis]|uniref:Undecaprenyl phosphate-alpha-4-amino-4-deoxy-L-arabinose arabinosyl transferase n=1 Tax=Candidatus Pandoraea novymonadis TaxID=1808959 RepID=A0ABX5FEC6_9BURK|nr:glycosyltransferase family 39 protein [Candidatus Pandoraea novymonadis]PSB92060.1 Undecaprenyl phosphate-alpha-4-amino-4-deoxy-L-arabinose arabinosyl transferase [Candidatus Pandoraea novymonadis]
MSKLGIQHRSLYSYSLSNTSFRFLIITFSLLWFGVLDYRHLISSDEGRYAEIAREIVTSGDWITIRYNNYKYFEKPPLQMWMNALTFMFFGIGEWQARFWTSLTGFSGILMVGYTGRHVFNDRVGLMSAVALGSAPLWALLGHFNVLDMGLSFMMTLTLCSLLLAQRQNLPKRLLRQWMWLCWASMGLAVLSKGLIGLCLPGAVLVIYTLFTRDWTLWKRLYFGSGLVIFFIITAPWFILIQLNNPEFFDFFFINEHFKRFLSNGHNREGKMWYFVPVFLVGFLPWLSILPQTVKITLKNPCQKNGFSPITLIWVWIVFIFLFFSYSHSKLISYLLPIAPAVAILLGLYLSRITKERFRRDIAGYALLLAGAAVLTPILIDGQADVRNTIEAYTDFKCWLMVSYATGLIGMFIAWRLVKHSAKQAIIAFAGGMFCLMMIAHLGHEAFGRHSSGILLVPDVKKEMEKLGPNTPFYSIGMIDHTMPYYLQQPMIMVQNPDELAFGISQEPEKWVPTLDSFYQVWRDNPKALALVNPNIFPKLKVVDLPMRIVAQDARRIIITKP